MEDIRPTGTCFDDALDVALEALKEKKNVSKFRIVHGLVTVKGDDEPFAHCWMIDDKTYMQLGIDQNNERVMIHFTKEDFESVYTIHDETRYTIPELMHEGWKSPLKNSGPYKQKYLEKCSDYMEA